MRGLFAGTIAVLLGFAAPVAAQDVVTPPLERVIDIDFPVRSAITECTVPSAVAGLAHGFKFAAGIEFLRAECARMGGGDAGTTVGLLNLRGMTIEDALNKLASMDPRYRWIDSDGVIVIRPLAAWSDPRNMLNFETERFVLEDATIGTALAAIISAITGEPKDGTVFAARTDQAGRRFNVNTRVTSAGGALDAIVRAHGASYWEVREGTALKGGRTGRLIYFRTFDGTGIGSGAPDPQ
jgi:hypothetical protein